MEVKKEITEQREKKKVEKAQRRLKKKMNKFIDNKYREVYEYEKDPEEVRRE